RRQPQHPVPAEEGDLQQDGARSGDGEAGDDPEHGEPRVGVDQLLLAVDGRRHQRGLGDEVGLREHERGEGLGKEQQALEVVRHRQTHQGATGRREDHDRAPTRAALVEDRPEQRAHHRERGHGQEQIQDHLAAGGPRTDGEEQRIGQRHGDERVALMLAGDTPITMALAAALFSSIRPGGARGKAILYLLLTMAPIAVVGPLLGPVLDKSRTGRRTVVILSAASRALVCLSMAHHLKGLLLFPEAFAALVLSKTYLITKSALVPSAVDREEELVDANSRLAVLGVVAGFAIAAPGAVLLKVSFLGGDWVLRLAA